ncbi:hypothetical protein CS542_02145 [Pedobacter sp. IW39]|nr:hypothetical protein CS542_02145 [Pedobacter sp. IW39]
MIVYSIYWSCRSDASNLFGLKANVEWNPLWSRVLRGRLVKKILSFDIAAYLRLRSTYGVVEM